MSEPPDLPLVLPVVDVLAEQVVWGIAGKRSAYRPMQSPLAEDARPLSVARGLREVVGHPWLYLADLDGIQRDKPHWRMIEELAANGVRLIVDAGLREASRARVLGEAGVELVIAALETLPHPDTLGEIVEVIGGRRTLFSLDLRQGRPLAGRDRWNSDDPISIGTLAIKTGIHGLIVLDLAGVGSGAGVATEDICRQMRQVDPDVRLVTGGGVRDTADVQNLLAMGVDSVLVASALHRGKITSADIATLHEHGTGLAR